ncbi:hypothetical protein LINGRAHAP2_LOCUS1658 [Linum grandiflorum]
MSCSTSKLQQNSISLRRSLSASIRPLPGSLLMSPDFDSITAIDSSPQQQNVSITALDSASILGSAQYQTARVFTIITMTWSSNMRKSLKKNKKSKAKKDQEVKEVVAALSGWRSRPWTLRSSVGAVVLVFTLCFFYVVCGGRL